MAALHVPAEALHTAVGRLRRATGLPVAFGGLVPDGRHGVTLTEFSGTLTGALRGLVVSAGNGLGGRVITTARPGAVDDYAADPRISHEYDKPVTVEGLRAIAAVPVTVHGTVSGVLYGGIREPLSISDRVLDAMTQVAARVSFEVTVRREVERRLAELETAAITRAARETPTAGEWEAVRLAHAQLRAITQEIGDAGIRARLADVCDRLARPGGRPADGRPNPLSPRELDVLALVAVGCGNAETAGRLGIRPETVKSYLRNAMRKLGTHTRTETVIAARRRGFLP
ncbi:LuxR C-terminal-related transcriptional regulator [Nonomuraea turcica]|uniref:LuxR C-terminal-related transcriptional regulator n=1 Tax=Nonomuraea sp. G32 TaxID=3067274 RepID=UPI00273C92ED|nr:LuxR C-terminal-related transcriptional regulator [Nonomuraea sp. G32]MDP4503375.1 LuxR C-terminal-related transcriptional regulator [Nonomuraea sp. G32]